MTEERDFAKSISGQGYNVKFLCTVITTGGNMRRAEIYSYFLNVIINSNTVISFKTQLRFRNFFFFFFLFLFFPVLFYFLPLQHQSIHACLIFSVSCFSTVFLILTSWLLLFFCFVFVVFIVCFVFIFSFRFLSSVSLGYFVESVSSFMNL